MPENHEIHLRSLGDCVIETPSALLTPNQEIGFATALFFALNRGRKITRDAIESVLWPTEPSTERIHHRLRQTILVLKHLDFRIVRHEGFLKTEVPICTDIERIIAGIDTSLLPPLPHSFDFLPDYSPTFSTAFSHWLDEKRREVNVGLIRLLLSHIQHARSRGEWARVEELTGTCRTLDPYNEEVVLARAESVALRGGKLEALNLLDEYVSELGTGSADLRLQAVVMRKRISERREASYDGREVGLIGRSTEMETLNIALRHSEASAGQCCVIEGAVGMGKSRLATEFAEASQLRGVQVRLSRCQPSDENRSLSVLLDLIPSLRKLRGAIGCSPETLETLDRLTVRKPCVSNEAAHPDPEENAENLIAAILDLFDAVSEEKPLLLLIDDAQWLDSASSTVFENLIAWSTERKLMMVFLVRTRANEWPLFKKLSRVRLCRLTSLSAEDSERFITSRLGGRGESISPAVITRFVSIGEGNPFFLNELVCQWTASGRLDDTPPSLVAITEQRLRRLSVRSLKVLQTTAVLARYSSLPRLERVLEVRSLDLFEALDELGNSSMIHTEKVVGESCSELCIACSHDLIADAALRLLSTAAKAAIHRHVAGVLEGEAKNHYSSAIVWESAMHWEMAGDANRALSLTTTYARHLMGIGLPNEAAKTLRKASEFCATIPQRIEILKELVDTLYVAGAWNDLNDCVVELRALSSQSETGRGSHSSLELMGFEAKWRSSSEWWDLFQKVRLCVLDETASPEHRVRAAVLGLKLATNVGTTDDVAALYAAVKPLLSNSSVDLRSRLYVEMVYHIDNGSVELGEKASLSLLDHERKVGSSTDLIRSLVNVAQAMRVCGRYEKAYELLTEAFEIAQRKNFHSRACTVAHHLVRTALANENLSSAKHWLSVAGDHPTPSEDEHTHHERLFYSGRIALAEGDVARCAGICEQIPSIHDQSLLRKISLVALKLRVAVLSKQPPEKVRPLLHALSVLYKVQRSRGGQDFEAFSLFLGMKYLGEANAADNQLKEYVSEYRREKSKLPLEMSSTVRAYAKTGA